MIKIKSSFVPDLSFQVPQVIPKTLMKFLLVFRQKRTKRTMSQVVHETDYVLFIKQLCILMLFPSFMILNGFLVLVFGYFLILVEKLQN